LEVIDISARARSLSGFEIHVIFKQLNCRLRCNPIGTEPGAQPVTLTPQIST
jgi:hypothetical protein